MGERIRQLKLKNRRSFWVLLLVEILLLLAGVPGLFGKDRVYEYGPENMQIHFGAWDEETGSCRVEDGTGQAGNMVDFVNISLPRGVYSVAVQYSTDTFMQNRFEVERGTAGYKGLLTNGESCYPEIQATGFQMWLLEDADGISIHSFYCGQGRFSVSGLTVRETNALNRIWIFCVAMGGLLVNLCYLYLAYDRKYGISVKTKTVHFVLALTVLFSSMPLMVDHIANSGDFVYHLMRVEGIRDSILQGQFPNRISSGWLQGYGYASPIFYGEPVLYIMALFRLVGFSILTSYRMFFFLLNIATVWVSYYCFKKIFQEEWIGALCAVLYTVSAYRIYRSFFMGGFAESIVLVFLPILAYGFYRVFTQDVESRAYKRSFIPLVIGFGGVIQTHLLTGELAGFFTILLCLSQIKKVFRKQTFLVLTKTVVYTCLVSAWFLIPFLDYMVTGDFVIHHVSSRTIQSRGLYPAHLLFAFPISGDVTFYDAGGMFDSQPVCLGIALAATLFLWAGLRFFGRTKVLRREELGLGKAAAWFALLSMYMSLAVFPWDRIQAMGGIMATLVSSLQFPCRMLSIATLMLVLLAGVTARCVMEGYGRQGKCIFLAAMAAMVLMGNVWLLTYMTYDMRGAYLYNKEGMGSGNVGGGEYLPYGTEMSLLVPRAPQMYGDVRLDGYEKDGFTVDVRCTASGTEPGGMDLPLLFYKGYRAWDTETGERFTVQEGENHSVRVSLPGGYSGNVRTTFISPFYWRIAEGVSVISLGALVIFPGLRKRHGKKSGEAANG